MRKFADSRHSGDVSTAKRKKDTYSSSIIEFYKQYPDIPAIIFTVAQVNNVKSALLIESRLLRHFTNPSNNTPLPIHLCLNSEGIYCPPRPKRELPPRPIPKIVEIDDVLSERGRMIKEMLQKARIDKTRFHIPLKPECEWATRVFASLIPAYAPCMQCYYPAMPETTRVCRELHTPVKTSFVDTGYWHHEYIVS
jgi:hypothetical protein